MLEYLSILSYLIVIVSNNALGADNQQGRLQILFEEPSETKRQTFTPSE